MREIIFDTETTGLSAANDRLVELGCVELINHIPTGRTFHTYLKPDCPMNPDAQRVHGLSEAFLADKPVFAAVVDEFLAFLGDARVVAHNASFDLGFINAELGRAGRPLLAPERIVDTLMLARRRHPAGPNSLDALCARYGVDTSARTLHGALLDASLLAEVYIELIGGRQAALGLAEIRVEADIVVEGQAGAIAPRPVSRPITVSAAESEAHGRLLAGLGGDVLWRTYLPPDRSG